MPACIRTGVLQVLGTTAHRDHPDRTVARGMALNPGTPVDVLDPFLDDLEMVMLVAINPGWGGQAFIPATLGRIEAVRRKIAAAGRDILIAVDGGITRRNIGQLAGRGVDVVVTGSAVFDGDVRTNIDEMTRALREPLMEPRGFPSTGSGQAARGRLRARDRMLNRWSEEDAARAVDLYGPAWGEAVALRTYASRLLGSRAGARAARRRQRVGEGPEADRDGRRDGRPSSSRRRGSTWRRSSRRAIPRSISAPCSAFRAWTTLDDDAMVNELRRALFDTRSPNPSIEALVHAFLPAAFVDHTHADAILTLTNQRDGLAIVQDAFWDSAVVIPYVEPGFPLAKAAAAAVASNSSARALVLMQHGLITWGQTARESYTIHLDLVTQAEKIADARARRGATVTVSADAVSAAWDRLAEIGPVLRGQLARPASDADRARDRVVLQPIVTDGVLALLEREGARDALVTPPLTTDHLIRTRSLPLWIDAPAWGDEARLRAQFGGAIDAYRTSYTEYVERHRAEMPEGLGEFDPTPRVVLIPGLGAICAGRNAREAAIARDITAQTLQVKSRIAAMGTYEGLSERELFLMEYRGLQHAKLAGQPGR